MNDDRQREDRLSRLSPEAEGARERWYERLLGGFGLKRESIRDDLEDALSEAGEDAFSAQERAMLKNVLGLHRIRVDDVMVPRADIVAVPADADLGEVLRLFRTAGHSRLPVYGEALDDPKGMVHIRDFLDFLASTPQRRDAAVEDAPASLGDVDLSTTLAAARILRPVLFVPRSMPAVDLLARMQTTRTHIALVIDEYGGTDGLVSIEDLVEMVVGDIEDEHDDAAVRMILPAEGDAFIADARASLEEVSEAVGVDLAAGDEAEEVDTIGGLIATLAGRVPSRGELIEGPGHLEFEVLDADPRRVKRLRIHRRLEGEPPRTSSQPAPPQEPEPDRTGGSVRSDGGRAAPQVPPVA